MDIKLQLLERIAMMEAELAEMRRLLEKEEPNVAGTKIQKSSNYDFVVKGIPEKLDGKKYIIYCLEYMEKHGEVELLEAQQELAKNIKKEAGAIIRSMGYALQKGWELQIESLKEFKEKPGICEFIVYYYRKYNL
jgi:hypothetical protein